MRQKIKNKDEAGTSTSAGTIVEKDLTADSSKEDDQEVSIVTKRISHNSRKEEQSATDSVTPGGLDNLARLFDRICSPNLSRRIRGCTDFDD